MITSTSPQSGRQTAKLEALTEPSAVARSTGFLPFSFPILGFRFTPPLALRGRSLRKLHSLDDRCKSA